MPHPSTALADPALSRYLMENNFWTECREVIQVGMTVCVDKQSLPYSHLCMTAAVGAYERGHAAEAWPHMKEALSIRAQHYSPENENPRNCDNLTNEALLIMTENATDDAFDIAATKLRKVIELAKPSHEEMKSVLHHHFANLGVCLTHQGNFDEALEWIDIPDKHTFNHHFQTM